MKTSTNLKLAGVTLMLFFFNIILFAQEKKVDVDLNINKGNTSQWYANPVVWVIGGAVFILLLVALLRNKNQS